MMRRETKGTIRMALYNYLIDFSEIFITHSYVI